MGNEVISMEVIRVQPDNGIETLGDMHILNNDATIFKCDTLELPWMNNQRRISCIPTGVYICKKVNATENIPYPHISITNVIGRDGCCIHKANYVGDLRGCIAVGDSEVDINGDGQKDVTNSGKTFDKMYALLPDEFKLTIK